MTLYGIVTGQGNQSVCADMKYTDMTPTITYKQKNSFTSYIRLNAERLTKKLMVFKEMLCHQSADKTRDNGQLNGHISYTCKVKGMLIEWQSTAADEMPLSIWWLVKTINRLDGQTSQKKPFFSPGNECDDCKDMQMQKNATGTKINPHKVTCAIFHRIFGGVHCSLQIFAVFAC